jgi:ketosteroid isomerase-like protein
MYHAIVRRRVAATWRHLNRHDHRPMLDGLAPRFTYDFVGDHTLGGTRTSRATMDLWWQRVFRLFPDIRWTLTDVAVSGWPHQTTVLLHLDSQETVAGHPLRNEVWQRVRLRWGRIVEIRTLLDLQRLDEALNLLAADGVAEAKAEPITG